LHLIAEARRETHIRLINWPKPRLRRSGPCLIEAEHASLGRFVLAEEGEPELS
jgi:hypothetical protein